MLIIVLFTFLCGPVLSLLEQALKRGVKIKILYGFSHNGSYNDDLSFTSQAIAEELQQRFQRHNGLFSIKLSNTHEKLLLCDETFYLIGSYNLLSFGGKYHEKTRREIMQYSEDREQIRELRAMYFQF
jgi:phosphatidylserine/phosphatidylglycerophosphate/cardiolipin synthase-like enzyme